MKKLIACFCLFVVSAIASDYDFIEDWFEMKYPDVFAIGQYDALVDADNDGWDNYSETRYTAKSGVASRPNLETSYPKPQISFELRYTGHKYSEGANVKVFAYPHASYDGNPMAIFTITPPRYGVLVSPQNDATIGYLRQGPTYFYAFLDLNDSNAWEDGEPSGICMTRPYTVGWDKNEVMIELTDKPVNGFVRFSWPADPAKLSYVVSIRRMIYGAGGVTNYTTVFAKSIAAPRNWIHEGDILDGDFTYGGGNPGLDWGGVIDGATPIPIGSTSTYDLRVDNVTVVPVFQIYYASTQLPMPTVIAPYGGAVQTRPRTEFQWRMSTSASAFELQIAPMDSLTPVYSSGVIAAPPPRDGTGLRVWSPPVHWGDILPTGALTEPMYRWRVRAHQPRDPYGTFGPSPSAYTDYVLMTVALGSNVTTTASSIYTTVTNSIVMSYESGNVGYYAPYTGVYSRVVLDDNSEFFLGSYDTPSAPLVSILENYVFLRPTNSVLWFTYSITNPTPATILDRYVQVGTTDYFRGVSDTTGVLRVSVNSTSVITNSLDNYIGSALGSIKVTVTNTYYPMGAATRISAYTTASFNDLPVAQKTLTGTGSGTVVLNGLPANKPYYIMAYIDQSGNRLRESWESWGYHHSGNASARWKYSPIAVFPNSGNDIPHVSIVMHWVDSDQDGVPDAYEYAMNGGLSGVPVGGP